MNLCPENNDLLNFDDPFCFFSVISLFELDLLHVDGKIFFFTLNDCVFFCSTFKDSRKHRLEAWTEARLPYFESYVADPVNTNILQN